MGGQLLCSCDGLALKKSQNEVSRIGNLKFIEVALTETLQFVYLKGLWRASIVVHKIFRNQNIQPFLLAHFILLFLIHT